MRSGSRISHYEVLELLQDGGPGEVYKARDLRQDRLVTLAVLALRPGLTAEDLQRRLNEARTAASLDHPNLYPPYEIEETEQGEILLAMAWVPGLPATLQRILDRALSQAVDTNLPADPDATQVEIRSPGAPIPDPAPLTGRRVSHFRIAAFLGGGGMGVLYRGEDTRLGRTVALKFLAPELSRDTVAKARFLNEARAASALDHPNVCTILDIGETEEGLLFLAMPLYQGESLEHRLARGPLPLDQALDVATQTARGLAKAHQNGIVHRDIKPANLFLTEDGGVKILDFGIAKLIGEAGPTRAGSFLGTPFYMSPEQTRGQEVDARSDVWSLGAVLYQMLTGRRPFAGGSDSAVIYAVLHEPPETLSHLRPEVPPEVERIVTRMLAKDPEERYEDAGEVLGDLRRAQGMASMTLPSGAAIGRPRRRAVWTAALALAFAAVAVLVGLLAWRRGREVPGPQPTNFRQLTDLQGKETSPCLSPDGTFFVYTKKVGDNSDIFLQRVEDGKPINLTAGSHSDNTQPAYSPDGQQIAFRSERDGGGIFIMGATGESPRRLTDYGFNPTWSPDGRQIAVATEGAFDPKARYSLSQIFRVDVATQTRRSLGVPDGVQPSWSPHGWRIAYWGLTKPEAHRAIWTIPVKGGTPVPVVDDVFYNWSPAWSPDGRFLYFASNRGGSMNLWRVAIDERSGEVASAPQPITNGSEWSALPSFSRTGDLLLYATDASRSFVESLPFDPAQGQITGTSTLVFQGTRSIYTCSVSPDGTQLALWSAAPQEDLLLVRMDGSDVRQLTNDPARDRAPRWSPDGRRILFYSNRSGKYEAWTIRPDGTGLTQVTNLTGENVTNPFWSQDGRSIGFAYGARGVGTLVLSGPTSAVQVIPAIKDGQIFSGFSWSQDGRFLAGDLAKRDSVMPGIVLWSLEDNSYRRLTRSGNNPTFVGNGTKILFTEPNAIRLLDVPSGETRSLLAPAPDSSYVHAGCGAGDRILCTVRTTDEGNIWILSLVGGGPG